MLAQPSGTHRQEEHPSHSNQADGDGQDAQVEGAALEGLAVLPGRACGRERTVRMQGGRALEGACRRSQP